MKLSDKTLATLARRVGRELALRRWTIVTAESCTGGFLAKCLTDIPGSSAWFQTGFVTYSNSAKTRWLDVSPKVMRSKGAVSEEVAKAMCRGAARAARADIAVALTGIAGPGGAVPGKPVGTVWIGWAVRRGRRIDTMTALEHFGGGRDAVRRLSVQRALKGIVHLIQ